jgi:hypothetical protein
VFSFEGPVWRLHLAEHLYRCHRAKVQGEIRDWTEEAFAGVELRTLQRELLLFALNNPSFRIEAGGDSISLHAMARRGWFAADEAEVPMLERTWSLTDLGHAVARGALQRARELAARVRHPVTAPSLFVGASLH